ncbi:hypothetical protein [Reyranella sp.]|uniref:hypothetical protein n=1 Tax=Reyranella sp. TaxID=1929291 RepID=UPI00272FB3D8|nr:hypothetical protein [Reyranella sp.]MDP2377497.1 hypothetical protein [Reyranella sp.]
MSEFTQRIMTLDEAIETMRGPALSEIGQIHHQFVLDNGSRSDRFYEGRWISGDPLALYEQKLLQAIEKLPPAKSYHEIGGGIGLVPITLGLMGHKAVNIDSAQVRIAHGENILSALANDYPDLSHRVQMLCASVPQAFAEVDTKDALAISTNLGAPRSEEFFKSFLRTVQDLYAEYIFDVCLLWGIHRTERDWQDHLEKVSTVWKTEPEFLFDVGAARYYRVRF